MAARPDHHRHHARSDAHRTGRLHLPPARWPGRRERLPSRSRGRRRRVPADGGCPGPPRSGRARAGVRRRVGPRCARRGRPGRRADPARAGALVALAVAGHEPSFAHAESSVAPSLDLVRDELRGAGTLAVRVAAAAERVGHGAGGRSVRVDDPGRVVGSVGAGAGAGGRARARGSTRRTDGACGRGERGGRADRGRAEREVATHDLLALHPCVSDQCDRR